MALLALVASGCGGESDDAPTKAEFVKQADAICQQSNDERIASTEKLFKKYNGLPPKAVEEDFIAEEGAPVIREQLEQLSALDPPAGEEDEVDALWSAFEKALKQIEAEPAGAITRGLQIFKEFEQMAIKYGFDECAAI